MMRSRAPSMIELNKALRRFRRNRCGSAAIEFAFIAPIFFALLFAVIETGIMYFAAQVLESGTQDTARLMLTHQAQDASMTQVQFKQDLCGRLSFLFNCDNIYVDVKSYAAGTAINIIDPIDSSGNFVTSNFTYQTSPGGSSSTVVVRAFYQWPLFVTQLGYNIANIGRNTSNASRLLAATAAFRVEPQ